MTISPFTTSHDQSSLSHSHSKQLGSYNEHIQFLHDLINNSDVKIVEKCHIKKNIV
jgi:hypothetical protein